MDRASDSGSEGWGFESLPAYQKMRIPIRVSAFFDMLGRTRKAGTSAHTGAKKCPVDTFLVRGRVPATQDAFPTEYRLCCRMFCNMADCFSGRGRVPRRKTAPQRGVGFLRPSLTHTDIRLCSFISSFPPFLVDRATFYRIIYHFSLFSYLFINKVLAFFTLMCYTV